MTPPSKAKQTALPIDPGPRVPVRIRARITHADNRYTKLQLWLSGDLITGRDHLTIRNADVVYFVLAIKPEIVIVDRENVSDDLWRRIKHLPEIELI